MVALTISTPECCGLGRGEINLKDNALSYDNGLDLQTEIAWSSAEVVKGEVASLNTVRSTSIFKCLIGSCPAKKRRFQQTLEARGLPERQH
ncbi:hypothetical protein G6F42_028793 [Rhizopus arrhizus]|nr:hypothetical protein G6F42_028793 [Rhizopus arrhizus]